MSRCGFDGAKLSMRRVGAQQFNGMRRRKPNSALSTGESGLLPSKKMAAHKCAIFMHCLPGATKCDRYGRASIDSPSSVVIDEAENRLHVQKAILASLLGNDKPAGGMNADERGI